MSDQAGNGGAAGMVSAQNLPRKTHSVTSGEKILSNQSLPSSSNA
jgi:hypothetical protein